ncbi:MAG: hypothetical protein P8L65_02545 [Flavobacteriaceae bacterium]|nr:hypothetical protein [Flavobacteriaceae bacterium]
MRKIVILLLYLSSFLSFSQMESGLRDAKKFGFWDNQNSEPVIILNDSTIYIGLEKSKLLFEPLDLDDSKLNELTPLTVKDTTYLVEQSGGVVVKYIDRTFTRIDKSFTHHNQYSSIPFVFNDEIYLLGGSGLFLHKNILIRYDFQEKEWFRTPTFGDIPNVIRGHYLHIKINNDLYLVASEGNSDIRYKEGMKDDSWFVYRLNLTSMNFFKLGRLNIEHYNIARYTHRNLFTDKLISRTPTPYLYIYDFKNNNYTTIDNNNTNVFREDTNIIHIEENTMLAIQQKRSVTKDNLYYKYFDSDIYVQNGEKHPIYIENNMVFYYYIGTSLAIIILLLLLGHLLKKWHKNFNLVTLNTKTKTLKYKGNYITKFDGIELDLLIKIANTKGEYISYNELLDLFKPHSDSYETLRKKRKQLMRTLSEKFKGLLNNYQTDIFIYHSDPMDKRARLIKLNEDIIKIIS